MRSSGSAWVFAAALAAALAAAAPAVAADGTAPADSGEAAPADPDGRLSLDFENVDLATFIKAYGEMTGRNYVLDPKARGTVTVISPEPVAPAAAADVFEAVLRVSGLAAVPFEGGTMIVPIEDARSQALATGTGLEAAPEGPGERMVTQVVRLRRGRVEDARVILHPLVSREGNLAADKESNTLVITDHRANVERLLGILREIDSARPGRYAAAYPLEHASAAEAAELVRLLLADGPETAAGGPLVQPDERTGRLVVLADEAGHQAVRSLVEIADAAVTPARAGLRVHHLRHAGALQVAETLQAQFRTPARPEATVVITPNVPTNSILVTAPADIQAQIESVLAALDVRRPQVFVEAIITEVDASRLLKLGAEWRLTDPAVDGRLRGVGGTNLPAGGDEGIIAQTARDPTNPPPGLVVGAVKGTFTWNGVEILNVAGLLQALRSDKEVNILSTPHLLAMDNEEAEIVVGEERPFLKSAHTTDVGSIVRTYEYKNLGLIMRLTPHVGPDDAVRLEIYQELQSFLEQIDVGAVVSTKRQARTTVEVGSGETVVIGGLMREDRNDQIARVPCIGSIPALGWLFKAASGDHRKTNLLIFITPRVVRDEDGLRAVLQQKRDEMEAATRSVPSGPGTDAREGTALLEK